ncbi:hypothetical protein FKW77_005498 [Venturia effusa]|uniref:Uncharacterized protein n=1 Tax=Venturia effusa TaxID=50376 RepID=A0A517LH86_9PEZI|nr:hypothetical protein FKW77_005498 [Venturia effusa]
MTSSIAGQRAPFHTDVAKSTAALNAPRLSTSSPNMSASVSKIGRGTKWSVVGATAIAISAAAALEFRGQQASLRASKKKDIADNDARYQSLLDAYGSADSLEDLQKAVGSYEAGSSGGRR